MDVRYKIAGSHPSLKVWDHIGCPVVWKDEWTHSQLQKFLGLVDKQIFFSYGVRLSGGSCMRGAPL